MGSKAQTHPPVPGNSLRPSNNDSSSRLRRPHLSKAADKFSPKTNGFLGILFSELRFMAKDLNPVSMRRGGQIKSKTQRIWALSQEALEKCRHKSVDGSTSPLECQKLF
jgi:hypothetical protein